MPVETFGYLDSLEPNNPVINDGLVNGDDHIRGIKSVLKATFPGLTGAASRLISGSWGFLAGDGSPTAPSVAFAAEPGLGLYRPSAGLLAFLGRLAGNGAIPPGAVHMFISEPAGLGKGGVGTNHEWLELDGSSWSSALFPRLATAVSAGTSINLPIMTDNGRFPRSRTASVPAQTAQNWLVGSHGHTASGVTDTRGAHGHNFSGNTAGMNANNPHAHEFPQWTQAPILQGGGGPVPYNGSTGVTQPANIDHGHLFGGSTDLQGNHAHNVAVTVNANDGAENRPNSMAFIFAIKT